ncbi:hypothetical protein C798_14280 [Herbaspirillum rubrisubalbicans Os34]|uniref:PQ-loop repeat-containing protein n=1 Tax=Herbaspirillum rubrisubalbicans Os34 TaxID=1235827 RepID=A0A6M3ZTV8_9BURK|nr:hypothetical protein C798_14280 [Herbaspirillum rubrisubalbicans Os34]
MRLFLQWLARPADCLRARLVPPSHHHLLCGSLAALTITMSDHITDLIGWGATLILLLTISSQVYEQWRSRSTQGVSHWLFAGQLAASAGFVTYSLLQGDWVFVVSNVFLLLTALLGQVLYLRNRRRQQGGSQA